MYTLADVPALDETRTPTATIAIARLDNNLRDPRYGKFGITQADVDGWKRNLSDVFGGRVAIDYDHSSDRGKGTKAAAWITAIGQQGSLVTADVQFTPAGARAVRDGDYRFISPTFIENYKDEHGVSHGKALLGAALTNRPVLRKGMPMLALSQTGTKLVKREAKKAARKKRAKKKLARRIAATTKLLDQVPAVAHTAGPALVPAHTVLRPLPGLDDAGRRLHAAIAAHAASTGQHYFSAMAHVTRNPSYADLSDIPPPQRFDGLEPERLTLYQGARSLAIALGISWMDALQILEDQQELATLQAADGRSDTPWLDTTPLPSPPRPWSDEDWQRDRRRAAAAGVDITHEAWGVGAEQGHDLVGLMAQQTRADQAAAIKHRTAGAIEAAQDREDTRRAHAIHDELRADARRRQASGPSVTPSGT
jgi:hypothetical protein